MSSLLFDLHHHQAWADAEQWRCHFSFPAALEDSAIRTRLHHIHLVQRAFLSIVRGQEVAITRPEDFSTPEELMEYARAYHEDALVYLPALSASRLEEMLTIPWFKDPPIRITVEQALTQAAMHSHYHRAQNATRLRELGGDPPLTDLILWYWKDRPSPQWGTFRPPGRVMSGAPDVP